MNHPIRSPKKLIEVALPLDAINAACAREKSIRHGNPSTLHLWWARRPLAAARAVIFAQLVNDPGFQQGGGFKYGKNKKEAAIERKRLFKIIEELVLWENTNNKELLDRAGAEIVRSWREICELNKDHPDATRLFNNQCPPGLHDPFAGGGAIPLEAQRLGLAAHASDLNPVAVLINKAMIEIPPNFAGLPPIGPLPVLETSRIQTAPELWPSSTGLAEDVRRYGLWMRAAAEARIGHYYPPIEITSAAAKGRTDLTGLIGKKLTVIAWIWARTVKSPNPALAHVDVPLVASFVLCSKEGKEVYVLPEINGDQYRFTIKQGTAPPNLKGGTKLSRGANFSCLVSGTPIEPAYIKSESTAKRMGARLMAIVAEGPNGRIYLEPSTEMQDLAQKAKPEWKPDLQFVEDARAFTPFLYGLGNWGDIFTNRQLLALTTFNDLITECREKIYKDAVEAGWDDDGIHFYEGGRGATAYADAISVYLAFAMDKSADYWSTICTWHSSKELIRNTFGRQALPMTWDFVETNPFSASSGNFSSGFDWAEKAIRLFPKTNVAGSAHQADAQTQSISQNKIVSTDPPYYDNVPYADLSDFFYIWLRKALRPIFPDLFATMAVPKSEELVAFTYRHGGKSGAEKFFLEGMTQAMNRLAQQSHPAFPVTIYYAFKQAETNAEQGTSSTGWETFLDAVIRAGFAISGTWPMRTELENRMRGMDSNALASSIVLVCNKRAVSAPVISRRELLRELNTLLPNALDEMTRGSGDERSPVAPVDLSQAIIGPGMAVFSKYSAVLEADGEPMTVRTALQLINRFLAEDDFDRDTQFCLHWFEQNAWTEGVFGTADILARAKGTSVEGVQAAGVLEAKGGKVRLKKWQEYPDDWNPESDTRNPVWESLHQLIRALRHNGEASAGNLLAQLISQSESVRQLAYRLYTLSERQGWPEDARVYNELITSWTAIETAANAVPREKQLNVFE